MRRASLEADPFDRFEDLADGLQAMEKLIRKKYHPETKVPAKCSGCGNALECKSCGVTHLLPNSFSGAQYVVEHLLGRPASDGKRINDTRNDIVHSRKELPDVSRALPEVTEIAEAALLAGVLDSLGYTPEEIKAAVAPGLRLHDRHEPQLIVQVVLLGYRRELIHPPEGLPHLRLTTKQLLTTDGLDMQTDPSALRGGSLRVTLDGYGGDWEVHSATAVAGRDPKHPGAEMFTQLTKVPRKSRALDSGEGSR
jgi:hypothetical protein